MKSCNEFLGSYPMMPIQLRTAMAAPIMTPKKPRIKSLYGLSFLGPGINTD